MLLALAREYFYMMMIFSRTTNKIKSVVISGENESTFFLYRLSFSKRKNNIATYCT